MSDQKFLLREVNQIVINEEKLAQLREDNAAGKPIIVTGIIQRADAKNQNGRIYPYDILRPECDRYLKEYVAKGLALGELDHTDQPIVELKNVSHIIQDMTWGGPDEKDVIGEVKLLDTPAGNIAKNLVLSGIPLGISSRAVGSVSKNESNGADIVGEDLQLVTWDLVATPSTDQAYLRLNEAKVIHGFNPNKIMPAKIRVKSALEELLYKK